MATTSLKLDEDMRGRVARLAGERRRSPHWVMLEAIAEYVEREERRSEFLRAGDAAWTHYETTGLHLTGAEVDDWMTRIEAGEDAALPECHG